MTTTLVLAGVHTPAEPYAASLVPHGGVRLLRSAPVDVPDTMSSAVAVVLEPSFAQTPDEWVVEDTDDLIRSILYSRGPVVVGSLPIWVAGKLTAADAWADADAAGKAVTEATLELAALLAALPFDAVVVSRELGLMVAGEALADRTLQDAVGRANTILANHTERGTLLLGGRAIDLSAFPALPY